LHPDSAVDEAALAQVQTDLRRRTPRYCARPPCACERLRREGVAPALVAAKESAMQTLQTAATAPVAAAASIVGASECDQAAV